MSSISVIAATVVVCIVAALLFYQSTVEGFVSKPIAGRPYNVPADLSRALVTQSAGSFPLSQQNIPGLGAASAPREALAQLRDLRELDSKIMVWLDAASQKEREQPGSLTSIQLQRRVMLQARLVDVRDQLGTGLITDTWKGVADELMALRKENVGWQAQSPSMDEAYGFGQGSDANAFLTPEEYAQFFGYVNAGVMELQGLSQPDPLQKVRLQQLQVIRQDLMTMKTTPPIKMAAAQLFLRQMLKPDQPLPTLFSIEPLPVRKTFADSSADIMVDLHDINQKDPSQRHAAMEIAKRIQSGDLSPQNARIQIVEMKHQPSRATTLCNQIREAFPEDADALGCTLPIQDEEAVIQTVCNRLRYSVPTVSPEQFHCPPSSF